MSSDALPDDPGTLKAMLLAERMQNERLRQIIKELQRHRFGRRAENLPEDQMMLGPEDVEQSLAGEDAAKPMTPTERSARAERRRSNRGSLPAHLPRVELIVDIDDKICPCCQRQLHCIGADRSERLDIVPAQFRVLVTVRPKYACRKCEDGVLQAAAPARPTRQWPRFSSPNTPTIFRCIATRRSTRGRASISTDQRWPTGLVMPPGTCVHCTNAYSQG